MIDEVVEKMDSFFVMRLVNELKKFVKVKKLNVCTVVDVALILPSSFAY